MGVERLEVAERLADVEVGHDAVAAHELAPKGHRLSALPGDPSLDKGRHSGRGTALLPQPGEAEHQPGARLDGPEHPHELLLVDGKRREGDAELLPLGDVPVHRVVDPRRDPEDHPSDEDPRGLQDLCRVGKAPCPRELAGVRHKAVLEHDVRVLDAAQRRLVLDLCRAVPLRALLHDEGLHPLARGVPRPDNGHVREGAVADPPLEAVEHPPAVDLSSGRLHGGRIAAVPGLGECPAARQLAGREAGEVPLLLLLRSHLCDGQGCEASVDENKCADARVHPRQLIQHQPSSNGTQARATVALDGEPADS
mmetsp:Transcript_17405/g.41626  ORF Transcript_17405/g.41626 Transcript_17405/m.41626 type:complete len:310 (+) Transcript_17405:694-1623(+)